MASPRYRLQRAAGILGGLLLGFVLTLAAVYLYINHVRNRRYEAAISAELGLPQEYFTLQKIREDGTVDAALERVVLLDRSGDTVATAPVVRVRLDTRSLSRTGPVLISSMDLERPRFRLVQLPNGEWNAARIFRVEAGGKPVQPPPGAAGEQRTYLVRNLRVIDGRALIATPATAKKPAGKDSLHFAAARGPDRAVWKGRAYDVRQVTNIQAVLPRVMIGTGGAMRVDVGSLTANVSSPDVAIRQMAGWVETKNGNDYRFAVSAFRTGRSSFDAGGQFSLASKGFAYDVNVRAHPLDLRDLGGLGFKAPFSGTARFALNARSLSGGRTRIAVTDAAVDALGSHAGGRLVAILTPNRPPVLTDTRISLEPLRISTLEELGLVKPTGFAGEVRGTIASVDEVRAGSGTLRLDLTATLAPSKTPDAEPSVLAATGDVVLGSGSTPFRLAGVRVEAKPLLLSTFASLAPAQAAMLKGAVRGSAVVSGTPNALTVSGGDLSYVVGNAAPTRVEGLEGRIAMQPSLSYDLHARAAPLSLATLTALFPALPFRAATLSGPITLAGNADRVAFSANLSGTAGGIDVRATADLGGPAPRFDLNASLNAFRTADVLAAESAPAAPLSGTVAARGTTEDFRFDANLVQGGGTLAVHGGIRRPGGGPMQFDVAGRAQSFNIGVLVGRPNLLAGPVTGPFQVSGGGREPIRFNVDLQGALGLLDVHGWYQQGDVPRYSVAGNVVGLDLSGVPGMAAFPNTRITGTIDVNGRGITPQTFEGIVGFDIAKGSTLGGVPVDQATGRIIAGGGLLRVDSLIVSMRGAYFRASGELGLTTPSAQGLAFTLRAPDLALIAGLFARTGAAIPRMEGSLAASGRVMGTLSAPHVIATGNGTNLRYGENRAATFALDVDLTKASAGWTGRASVDGTNVTAAGQTLADLHLRLDAQPTATRFAVSARRDADTDLVAAGTLEMPAAGAMPTAAVLDTLSLRLGGSTWQLAGRARLAYEPNSGIAIQNLNLVKAGGGGSITANGTLPPTGNAGLTFAIRGLDLTELHRLYPPIPAVTGTLSMDASVRGAVETPVLNARAWIYGLRFGGAEADSVFFTAATDATGMTVRGAAMVGGRTLFTADGRVPVTISLGGTVPGMQVRRDQPMNVRVSADSLPVALLAGTVPGYRDAAGVVRGDLTLTGTPQSPVVSGQAAIAGGELTVDALGVHFARVNGSVRLAGKVVTVDSLVAYSNGGWARLSGTANVADGQHPQLDLTATMHDFQVIDRRRVATLSASTTADAPLRLTGTFPSATVSGGLRLDDGTIWVPDTRTTTPLDVVDVDVGNLGADTVATPTGGAAALLAQVNAQNLTVSLGDDVWIQNADAHIQIGGDLDISRSGGATRVTGDLEAKRGTYTFRYGGFIARDFTIDRGRVRFYGTPELNPALDIVAKHTVRPVDAGASLINIYITVGGTLQNPSIALSSDTRPPLGESELLSLLVFGRRTNDLGALPGQLAQGLLLQEALGGFVSGLESSITRTGIFDYVRITTASSFTGASDIGQVGRGLIGMPTLELGKQLSDRVFLTLELADVLGSSATSQTIGLALDAQITAATSVRAAYEPVKRDPLLQSLGKPNYQFSTDVRRRWEYGRPRNRPAALPAPTAADTVPHISPSPAVTSPAPAPAPPPPPPPPPPAAPPPAQPQGGSDGGWAKERSNDR